MLEKQFGLSPIDDISVTEPDVPELSIRMIEGTEAYGKFIAEPLDKGWGVTLGNPLRRTLLSGLPGTAINWVKIEGIEHEYSTLKGMREEVNEFLMNAKGIRLRSLSDRSGRLRLEVEGEGEVKAGDIMATADFEIVNPGHHLATLDSADAHLSVEFSVEQGQGYKKATEEDDTNIGVLPIDSIFTPIKKANFSVQPTRVGQRSDWERLTLEIWTDGSIDPQSALQKASESLMDNFYIFSKFDQGSEEQSPAAGLGISPDIYNTPVETLDLSARTLNCLKRAGINRVGEVIAMPEGDLLKIRNFGRKSLDELFDVLAERNMLPES
ncbi:MAG: DNA-directed RNA polymerase subunit alpha [Dehalococcoidia bacterium]|nr:DNA-directed RNA polymerase subunit alpha [Dehalococcoidia bacterium]